LILDADTPVFNVFTFQVPMCNLLLIFLCTRFHLHPPNRPVPILRWEFLNLGIVSNGWVVGPSHNPQPGGPGILFSRFSSSSLYRSLCKPQGSSTGFGLLWVFHFPSTLHIWRAFPYPPPGEAPNGRPVTPHGAPVSTEQYLQTLKKLKQQIQSV
jgi:hypothetical protein